MSLRQARASRNNPCRVCGRGNQRCLNYDDGGVLCMVHDSPDAKQIDCGPVGVGFYYPPAQGNVIRLLQPKAEPYKTSVTIAPLEVRNKAYRVLLESLGLSEEHQAHLTGPARRLPESMLGNFATLPPDVEQRKRLVQSALRETPLDGVPGFYRGKDGFWTVAGCSGILIPYRTPSGLIQGLQIRCDDSSKGKYVWFSSNGYPQGTPSGTFYHYTHGIPRLDVWVCEGALKAMVASVHTDEAFIGLPGCHISDLHAMVAPLPLMPRFILAPDADYRTNDAVRNAWTKNAQALHSQGHDVRVATWEPEQGKGIDDVVINSGVLPRHDTVRQWAFCETC